MNGWLAVWVDGWMKQPAAMGTELGKPDPRRTRSSPDLARPQFPLWTKRACDVLRAPNLKLTHSGLSFSHRLAGLGSGPGNRAHAPRSSLSGRVLPGPRPRPLP